MIQNVTKGTIVAKETKLAESFLDNFLGLLNKKNPRSMIFKTRFGIHTFFMKEPIDILVLNNKNQVVKMKKNLKPWRIFLWNPEYNKIIELASSLNGVLGISLGDQILID